jgi:hypothetical protein
MGNFRRGATAIQVALSLMVTGGFCAMAMELAYLQVVSTQLQTIADSASHAALLKLDGTAAGVTAARNDAKAIALTMKVNNKSFVLPDSQITFGDWDPTTKTWTPTANATNIDSVSVRPIEFNVGLGLGKAFLGQTFNATACGAVGKGPGNANTGVVGGPGVRNGHFDVDTVQGKFDCPGPGACGSYSYYMHSHTYDDAYSTTEFNSFTPNASHFPINGCATSSGSITTCNASLSNRLIPKNSTFKLLLINTLLSKGGKMVINGVTYKTLDYGNIPVNNLTNWSLDAGVAGSTRLTSLVMQFDVDSIANCELHPTPPTPTWNNTPGIYNEWRNGALTIQAVKTSPAPTFIQNISPTRKNGGHEPVINFPNGLLWENYFFWHWEAGIQYTVGSAASWTAQREALACFEPEFIDDISAPGNVACN